MTREEAVQQAADLGLEGPTAAAYVAHHAGPPPATAPTTPPPIPSTAQPITIHVAPTTHVHHNRAPDVQVQAPPPIPMQAPPVAPTTFDGVPPMLARYEPSYETSDSMEPPPEAFDVDANGRRTTMPNAEGRPVVQGYIASLRERPTRTPWMEATGFRPQLSPESAILHAAEIGTPPKPAPAPPADEIPYMIRRPLNGPGSDRDVAPAPARAAAAPAPPAPAGPSLDDMKDELARFGVTNATLDWEIQYGDLPAMYANYVNKSKSAPSQRSK